MKVFTGSAHLNLGYPEQEASERIKLIKRVLREHVNN